MRKLILSASFLLIVMMLSGCTSDPSILGQLNLVNLNINCNGQNSCSPGQNGQINVQMGSIKNTIINDNNPTNISAINSIMLTFIGTNTTINLTNYDQSGIISNLENTGNSQITLSFDTPILNWSQDYLTVLTINYTDYQGVSWLMNNTKDVIISKPKVTVHLIGPSPLQTQDGYQFISYENNEGRSFDVFMRIYVASGTTITTNDGSALHLENSTDPNYAQMYHTDVFTLNPTTNTLTLPEVITKKSDQPSGDTYQTKVQIFWTKLNDTPLTEDNGTLPLN